MNTKLKNIATGLILLMGVSLSGCDNFDDINTNPDKPSEATAPWLATGMITTITSSNISTQKSFLGPYRQSKYILFTERKEGAQYNNLGRADFGNYLFTLKNIKPMLEYASVLTPESNNSYEALAHFIRAWQFFQLTMYVGDIPYSEAIQGDEGLIKPKYDTQKDVIKGILEELDQANDLFSKGENFSGDFIYGGDVDKWRRLVNSFELYVLINLSNKTDDTDLNVISKFNEVAKRPLMRDFTDNFAVTYTEARGYCYPWSNTAVSLNPFTQYTMLSATYIDLLKENKDRRLFCVAEPAELLLSQGKSASDFDAYIGVEASDEFDVTVDKKNSGEYSDLNLRYVESATAEPAGLLCHWDVEFILAEAAVRGWTNDDAQAHYANGIKNSMNFYARYTDSKYTHGVSIDDAYINTYTDQVALTGSPDNKIKQIIDQKYMAGFFHNQYFSWFEFRRTGYPEFILNPNSNMNPTDNTKFPTKWQYPQSEIDYNNDNLKEALDRQYGGSDDFNGIMWILN
ncbi:SusD/RagB family nutrient-binding outer membrane lipoprotein [Massilibacteroides sp.]|uniref:SusD/RagB family nutrient-binding outer membrane lipoprotein n=1 Tax=Massilibacteroides sp. TaxID=2034766 RepID=UPI002631BD22|nr:SusD/RagB family nutrient-binding outer membrane lipoprotein [Massilibacteroides sp.]MDD4514412.1 SusD/RagB family nutrient-binding outer membrane lipoprotein [Massilibacteroides sp.]